MKAIRLLLTLSALLSLMALAPRASFAAPFTAGTLVVERLGNGSTTLSGSVTVPISVLEVTTSGSLSQTITLASSGTSQQTDVGLLYSNSFLNTYVSGGVGYVSVPGLNLASSGTTNNGSSNNKVNSTLDASGSIINRTLFPTTPVPGVPFSSNAYRSSIATSGSTFYASGGSTGSPNTGGIWYYNGSSFLQVTSTATGQPTSTRNVEIYGSGTNAGLFFTSAVSSGTGVFAIGTGVPTSATQTAPLQINTGTLGTLASPYGFVMFDTNNDSTLDLAYIADDRPFTGGGLEKWTYNGTAWSNSWWLLVGGTGNSGVLQSGTGVGFAGLRGLAGTYDAVNGASLYATTTESNNRLISILDTGTTTPTTYTTLLSSGTNYVFRGVDLSPVAVPEPSTCAMALAGLACGGWQMWRRRRLRRPPPWLPERAARPRATPACSTT
jgi:hypothetical protein